MDNGFSILMCIFAVALFLYAAVLAISKDYKMLPYRAQVSVKPKNPKEYTLQLAKVVALVGLAVAAGTVIALWDQLISAIVIVAGVIASIWAGTSIAKDR